VFVDGFTPISQIIHDIGICLKWVEEVAYYHKLRGKKRLLNNREGLKYKRLRKLKRNWDTMAFIPFTVNNLMFSVLFLISGIVVSIVTYLVEIAVVRYNWQ